jgi:hypothetical protein
MEMAKESGFIDADWNYTIIVPHLETFAELVRADERNRTWTQEHWTEYERSIAAAEREACAKLCESEGIRIDASYMTCAAVIRARGQA